MTREKAIETLPIYSGTAVHIYDGEEDFTPRPTSRRHVADEKMHRAKLKYGLSLIVLFIWAATMMVGCIVTGMIVRHNTWIDARAEFAEQLEQYKAEQAQAEQAEHWLSGDASREAAINQAIESVAPVIAKLSTDAQKATEACCILARVMSPLYPNSFQEVAEAPQQWMFYDGSDRTYSQHDWDIAESIIRPYMESGIVPKGLTANMVYADWTSSDYVLRDQWEATSSAHYWRYE